jgi:hypothetical protein
MRRTILCAVIAIAVAMMTPGATLKAFDGLSATLNGKPIPLVEVGSHSCHDFDYPILRCFMSARELEADLATRTRVVHTGAISPATVGYVIVYEHASYAGSQLALSANQPWLSSIGWNDIISSFKSFGATGNFREDSPAGGFIYTYGPSSQVPSLNGTYNDKFSAFYIY